MTLAEQVQAHSVRFKRVGEGRVHRCHQYADLTGLVGSVWLSCSNPVTLTSAAGTCVRAFCQGFLDGADAPGRPRLEKAFTSAVAAEA